jgi:hypothetical protein
VAAPKQGRDYTCVQFYNQSAAGSVSLCKT